MDEARSLVDVHFLPVQGCGKKHFLPATAYPRRSGDRHGSRHALRLHILYLRWRYLLFFYLLTRGKPRRILQKRSSCAVSTVRH